MPENLKNMTDHNEIKIKTERKIIFETHREKRAESELYNTVHAPRSLFEFLRNGFFKIY